MLKKNSNKKKNNASNTSVQNVKTQNIKKEFFDVSFLSALGNKKLLISMGIFLGMVLFIFYDFLFFKKTYLFKDIGSDIINQIFPYLIELHNYLIEYGIPSWSFASGMGQNIFSFTFTDPMEYLSYFMHKENLPYLIGYIVFIEIIISGIVFYKYLKTMDLSDASCIIGGLLYAFSGFNIVSGAWIVFTTEVTLMALTLLGFEKLYQKNIYWLLPIPILYVSMQRPFNLLVLSLFLFLYITWRFFQRENTFIFKKYAFILLKTAGVASIGLVIASPFLFEHIRTMLESPRGSGENSLASLLMTQPIFKLSDSLQFGTAMTRMFASDILGSGSLFRGWQNILEAPQFYCGIASLLLIPQVFVNKNTTQKIVFGVFLGIWILIIIFPYFRYAFWFFTGDYYRSVSFYIGLVFTLYAIFALEKMIKNGTLHIPLLIGTLSVLIILLYYPYFPRKNTMDSSLTLSVTILLCIYTFLLVLISKKISFSLFTFFFFCVIELSYFSFISVNRRDLVSTDDLHKKIGYNDYSNEAIAYIKKIDNSLFYRVDKNYYSTLAIHGSLNDGMAQEYFGTSSYNSFNSKYYVNYQKLYGIINKNSEVETRWAPGLNYRVLLEGMNSVKYLLTKQVNFPLWRVTHDSLTTLGDVTVWKHKFALPLGYCYDKIFPLTRFEPMSNDEKDYISLMTAVVLDADVSELSTISQLSISEITQGLDLNIYKQLTEKLYQEAFQITSFSHTFITGNVNVNGARMMYFSIPYENGWDIQDTNGNQYKKYILSNGMTGIYLPKAGKYQLELKYTNKMVQMGIPFSILGIFIYAGMLSFVFINKRKKNRVL